MEYYTSGTDYRRFIVSTLQTVATLLRIKHKSFTFEATLLRYAQQQ